MEREIRFLPKSASSTVTITFDVGAGQVLRSFILAAGGETRLGEVEFE